ncbi:hypothetical protein HNQ50_000103 [Silvimonas terrae]|uniref:Uncharacterized protein n=1 Tax=Silvimonas terrae TaxID=300266 RepID=A0A840RAE8_9NEIS|nr:hypothetical protein [Silvimonas terrae]MBB5189393.1 hypothetical protein [Silvimonas terrae]
MSTCPLRCPGFLYARPCVAVIPPARMDWRLRALLWLCERARWHDLAALLRGLPDSNEAFVFF